MDSGVVDLFLSYLYCFVWLSEAITLVMVSHQPLLLLLLRQFISLPPSFRLPIFSLAFYPFSSLILLGQGSLKLVKISIGWLAFLEGGQEEMEERDHPDRNFQLLVLVMGSKRPLSLIENYHDAILVNPASYSF